MQKGFTLAEVLITLAIIGVVAALTIPVLVQKYQNKQFYTQFMKMYNTLNNAMELTVVENGSFSSWSNSNLGVDDFFNTYFAPFLKVSNVENLPSYTIKALDGADVMAFNTAIQASEGAEKNYVLSDGSSIIIAALENNGKKIVFAVDTNGHKGPNIMGRDIFDLVVRADSDKDYVVEPLYEAGVNNDACSVNGSGGPMNFKGIGCPDRLLKEGKMDY